MPCMASRRRQSGPLPAQTAITTTAITAMYTTVFIRWFMVAECARALLNGS